MNFIQTLFVSKFKSLYEDNFGWIKPEYNLMSWALSCLQLKKNHDQVDLYCNSEAADCLIGELNLPYTKVYLSHDKMDLIDERLWALPKILTYSVQNEPFLHIDGDAYLFDKLPSALLNGGLISQNIEEASDYYLQTQQQIIRSFAYFPNCIEADFQSPLPIKAVNAGILGGSNISFFKEYTELALKYISNNIQYFISINVDRFNVFFEQHLFYALAKEKELPISVLINETVKDNQYLYLGNFHEIPCRRTYLHLLGHYKKDEYTCRQMASKLRQLYPCYYHKIISLFKKRTNNVFLSLYSQEKCSTAEDYFRFMEISKDRFRYDHINNDVGCVSSQRDYKNASAADTLLLLEKAIRAIENNDQYCKTEAESDFKSFSESLTQHLNAINRISYVYIYGRDLDAVNWFCELFGDESEIMSKMINKCDEVFIVESKFDWAGLFNKHIRVGVRYYEDLELFPGEFYNLIVPEIWGDGFSLQDIDEMEYIILSHLEKPLFIYDLFSLMLVYVEEDVVRNHLCEYKELFIELLKQLTLKKAIKPAKNMLFGFA